MRRAVALGQRRGLVGCQRVHTTALVDPIARHVSLVPCALRNADRTRDNTRRDFGFDTNLARRALNSEHVAVSDTARRGVGRIDPAVAGAQLAQAQE